MADGLSLGHIFAFNIAKAKHAIKHLKMDVRVISIVLSDKPIKKYIAIPFKSRYFPKQLASVPS